MLKGSRTGRAGWIAALALALALIAASQASGAQQIGESYSGSGGVSCNYGGTWIQTSFPANTYSAPYDGVITSWSNQGYFWPTITFKVVRLGTGSSYSVVGSNGPRTVAAFNQKETYPARIPVRQGDVIGGHIPVGDYLCIYGGSSGDTVGVDDVNLSPGASGFFDATYGGQVPIEATIERDGDGDGYGDETQDGCPTNGTTHGACPLPTTLGQTPTPFSGGQSCVSGTRVITASPGIVSAAPQDGVITSWGHKTQADVGTGTIRLKMLRPLGGTAYRTIGESSPQTPAASKLNTYPVRIPVREGDRLGLAINGTVPCSQFTAPGSYARVSQDLPSGSSATFGSDNNGSLDVSARLEADADGDGYGDTTQDRCPTDPSTQGTCPVTPPPGKSAECVAAEGKLAKAKAKLTKLKKNDAPAKKVKKAKKKVKKAKAGVRKAC